MTRTAGTVGMAVAGVAVAGGLYFYSDGAARGMQGATSYAIDLRATPRNVDEGDLVEFLAAARPTGDTAGVATGVMYTWDFGDGASPATGLDLTSLTHRFADGGAEPTRRQVQVRVGATAATVNVNINNVAPTIRSLTRSRPARQGVPVDFLVAATDPGQDDELTFTWDFGDGSTATGQSVSHTFGADGTYDVTVTVNDGDGGTDQAILSVPVGDAGSFRVSGDLTLAETKVGRVALTGTSRRGTGLESRCEFRLAMHGAPTVGEPIMTLSAQLRPGLGERRYRIGQTNDWDGMRTDEADAPLTFFADFSAPAQNANRDFDGLAVGGPFWSRNGLLTVEYFDGTYLELSYWAMLVENIPAEYAPRTVFVEGTFSSRVDTSANLAGILGGLATGSGNVYTCGRDDITTFAIDGRRPLSNASNVDFASPDIEIAFTKPVDATSIGNNVHLDLRMLLRGRGAALRVPGAWEVVPGDPRAIRFVPQSPLRSGVIYCIRVKAGSSGVRSADGSILDPAAPDYNAETGPACGATQPFVESNEWAFSTRVELEHARADVYQASKAGGDTPLVPNKPTVSRVYTHWTPKDDVHDDAEVKRVRARIAVLVDGQSIYPARRVWLTRPDFFTADDARFARNSVNFFDWRPVGRGGSVEVQPVVEFIDEDGASVGRFDGMRENLQRWDRAEVLSFDYYFLPVNGCGAEPRDGCDWSAGVGQEWIERAHWLMAEDRPFTTQNFPVVGTVGRPVGTLAIDEPAAGPCTGGRGICYDPGGPDERRRTSTAGDWLLEAAANSRADVVVGFVPPGYLEGATGSVVNYGTTDRRTVLVELNAEWQEVHSVVPHEFGHFFDLGHCPDVDRSPDCAYRIQGIRVSPSGRTGLNKHDTEGNQEATSTLFPIMRSRGGQPRYHFITTAHYLKLFSTIPVTPRRLSRAAPPIDLRRKPPPLLANLVLPVRLSAQAPAASAGTLVLTGEIVDGRITIGRVQHRRDLEPSVEPPSAAGAWTLDQLDGAGDVIRSTRFDPSMPDPSHRAPGDSSMTFALRVPAFDGLTSVRITSPAGQVASRTRSRQPPALAVQPATSPDGPRTLRWSTSDADGDDVRVSVYLRGDDPNAWVAAAVDTSRSDLTIGQLPTGSRVQARLIATDGFNVSTVEVELGPGAPPTVVAATPADGSNDVATLSEVIVTLSGPLPDAPADVQPRPFTTGWFVLTGPDGEEVEADVLYVGLTSTVILSPVEPLQPRTRYNAVFSGVQTSAGSGQTAPSSWSFTTGPAAADAASAAVP